MMILLSIARRGKALLSSMKIPKKAAFGTGRPWRRELVKLACRFFLGSKRAHYHSWLPSLAITGRSESDAGRVTFRGREVLRLAFSDALARRAGERIVIIGSGPSVAGRDFSLLPSSSAICLNGAISLIGSRIAEPLAVAIEDERFVWRHMDMIRNHLGRETLCLMSPGAIRALLEIDGNWFSGRTVVLIDDIRKPYDLPRRQDDELSRLPFVTLDTANRAGFSAAPDLGVFQGGSVAISALQFALATGAREIGFIGVDISNADSPRFYEADGRMAFSGIAGAEARIIAHVALARDAAEARGVKLVNHSEVSALKSIGLPYRPLETSAS